MGETDGVTDTSRKVLVGLPDTKGLSVKLLRTFRAHGVDSFFQPSNMLHHLRCSRKDPVKINCEVIGNDSGCRSTYIGETGRTLKTRFMEHGRL